MGFIRPDQPDIVVSYARVNDTNLGGKDGWVTTLCQHLSILVDQRLGRIGSCEIWMDRALRGNEPIPETIRGKLSNAAALVVVHSTDYTASDWCLRELSIFIEANKARRRIENRIFIVEFENTNRSPEFGDRNGYRFWREDRLTGKALLPLGYPEPTPDQPGYYDTLNTLAIELAEKLGEFKVVEAGMASAGVDSRKTIFLAETGAGLEVRRDEVKRYLNQAGIEVLPATRSPRAGEPCGEAVKRDLARSMLFVQLLDLPTPEATTAADLKGRRAAAAERLRDKQQAGEFDVFLCHNTLDKPEVREIGRRLEERGLHPWLDEEQLRPGQRWLKALEAQIGKIGAVAVFVGENGLGPWQDHEQEAFIRESVRRGVPSIPVVLPSAPANPALPIFLAGMMWVDFRLTYPVPLEQLIWGITGHRGDYFLPAPSPAEVIHPAGAGTDRELAHLQKVCAAELGIPIMAWRSRDLDMRGVTDELLNGPTVIACDIEEFKASVVERVSRPANPPRPGGPPAGGPAVDYFVFVNSGKDDLPMANEFARVLSLEGIGYSLPVHEGSPSDIRQDLEQNLKDCDALVLIFGATELPWVRAQILQARKVKREIPLPLIGVYEGPPPETKASLNLWLPILHHIDCRQGPNQAEMRRFLGVLRDRSRR